MIAFTKIIILIIVAWFTDGTAHEYTLSLPSGTTLQDCIADHTPAVASNTDGSIRFGWTCAEIDPLPASKA